MTLTRHEKPHHGETLASEKAYPASSLGFPGATSPEKQEQPVDRKRSDTIELPRLLSKLLNKMSHVLLNRTNLLISATALILSLMSYRYVQWTQLEASTEACRAALASVEHVSPDSECFKVLLGPRPPPPWELYKERDGYQEGFEDMLHEYLLTNEDHRFLPLWQFLPFGNRPFLDPTLFHFATVAMPLRLATLTLPALYARIGRHTGVGCLWDICTWLFCYYAICLTSVWFQIGELWCAFLKWSYEGRSLVTIPPEVPPGIDAYEILLTFVGWILAFTPISISKTEDVKQNDALLDLEGKEPGENDSEVRGSTTTTENVVKSPRSGNKLVLAWRLLDFARLVPVVLISGWRVIPTTLINMLIRFRLVNQIRKILGRRKPPRLRRVLYLCLWLITMANLNDMDVQLIYREPRSSMEDFLRTEYFYRKHMERGYREDFSSMVDRVIRGETPDALFNSTELHAYYEHPFIGNHVFPEPWNRIRTFLGQTGHGEDEIYAWMRNEL